METAAVAQNYHQTPKKSLKIVIETGSLSAELTKLLAMLIWLSKARRISHHKQNYHGCKYLTTSFSYFLIFLNRNNFKFATNDTMFFFKQIVMTEMLRVLWPRKLLIGSHSAYWGVMSIIALMRLRHSHT